MKKLKPITNTLMVLLLGLTPVIGWSADNPKQDRPHGPPPEAIKACAGKQTGDKVTFNGRRGETIEASCQKHKGQMLAVPANMPKPRDRS